MLDSGYGLSTVLFEIKPEAKLQTLQGCVCVCAQDAQEYATSLECTNSKIRNF